MMSARTILLNPGPVTLSDRVRAALGRDDCCHREPEFAALTQSINKRLLEIYEGASPDYAAVTLAGSGTSAVEAMLRSFTRDDGMALLVANGVYGERMAAILDAAGRPHAQVGGSWLDPMDLDTVARLLREKPAIDTVIAVHHETTTGRLNDIDALGKLCREHDCGLLLDAVSSFGAEQIRFRDWNLRALAATANKCLHGVTGMALVIAETTALESAACPSDSVYFDLGNYYRQQNGSGYSPFTPAVHSAYALDAALDEMAQAGGWRARRRRYLELAERIAATLRDCGIQPLIDAEESAASMRAYRLPPSPAYQELHDNLKDDGFVIYAGQGALADSIFRIANMGDIRDEDAERLCDALKFWLGGRA